ncbi:DNA polymerase IV [Erysipelothrix sp. strain 2 (EsS2-7-Brazil)]|uniref:DNA polymerase IV n=1 Tax=Erysipelothrix sp. strain 2 (EsS2-7-Brazil) TaxID=2500579 RepID=UPI00190E21D4|nr:DNA polymerase IV [Erysipelothrix sp. strain 2 (EsS2-7-Brazil)]MBK2404087.1 DNA polymerase IV [Erysipelothrix sp. strain 2 (EsS2-7-Brazil)]
MKQRYILHCDIDYCFAQIEIIKNPSLANVPMCVGGDESKRHGIVLARNPLAKAKGVKTAETLKDARRKCPGLVIVPPSYEDYLMISNQVKDIYRTYTDKVESFGIDEAWVDISDSILLFGKPGDIATEIQKRIKAEVGLTVSIGMSFNKIFAKLGSDFQKPNGLTILMESHMKQMIWPLPVQELLYVGPSTQKSLNQIGIRTIGDLACANENTLHTHLGKMGSLLKAFANGEDSSEVNPYSDPAKSIGNGMTTPQDLVTIDEVKRVLLVLAESVSSRCRKIEKKGSVLRISIRDHKLETLSRQKKLNQPINTVQQIVNESLFLVEKYWDQNKPLRSITITLSDLVSTCQPIQLSLFDEPITELDETLDTIRERFGHHSIKRASVLLQKDLDQRNPQNNASSFGHNQ